MVTFTIQFSNIYNLGLYKHLKFLKMLYFIFGVVVGIWIDQTFTLPSVQEYLDKGIQNIKQKQKKEEEKHA